MKRFFSILLASLVMTAATGQIVWAGVDYTQYNQQARAQSDASTSPREGQNLQHTSKYQREQQNPENALPQNADMNKPAGKYERPNWAPHK